MNAAQLALGELSACARLSNGEVGCWGYGGLGATGNGQLETIVPRPVVVRQGPGPVVIG